jgi:hypothetical protein
MARYIDDVDREDHIKEQEIKVLFRDMAVERYGYSLGYNYNKDRGRWQSLGQTCNTVTNTNAPIDVVKEALETAMKQSPEFFPKAQKILNEICAIQARIIKENTGADKTMDTASDENLSREKLKSHWIKKIGIHNVLKAEQEYIAATNLPNSSFFNNAIWGGINRQEPEALHIIKGYEEKPTGKTD